MRATQPVDYTWCPETARNASPESSLLTLREMSPRLSMPITGLVAVRHRQATDLFRFHGLDRNLDVVIR